MNEPPASPDSTLPPAAPTATGTIIRSTGSWYDVQLPDRVVPSKVRGKFRLAQQHETTPAVVGDRVTIRLADDDTGLITEIYPRHNKLTRRAAGRRVGMENVLVANVDAAWVIQAPRMPRFNPGFVDRFLVMAAVHDIRAGIVINKMDLLRDADEAAIAYWRALYTDLGYDVLCTSAHTGAGLEALRAALAGKINVVAGPSGVGKSTLLNTIEPGLNLRTNAVSEKTRKGKHTTTYAALYPLTGGGFVADTPGIRAYGIIDLEPADLGHYYVEFRPYLHACRFPNCTHDHEPDCAVKAAVEAGTLNEDRYISYLNILFSLHLGDKDVGR